MQIEAVVFDWAGTVVDFGSRAPVAAFRSLFASNGVEVSEEEVRAPMGTEKKLHIQSILDTPRVRQAWKAVHGNDATSADVDRLYEEFIPIQIEVISQHAELIDGTREICQYLQENHIGIGTTTGYSREMMTELLQISKAQGFDPDCVVASDDIGATRPAATGALKNLVELNVTAVKNCIKVDDTAVGIEEGLNAGMWTVAVVLSGNGLALSKQSWQRLDDSSRTSLRQQAYQSLGDCGAHYLIDSVADLKDVIVAIDRRLADGERP